MKEKSIEMELPVTEFKIYCGISHLSVQSIKGKKLKKKSSLMKRLYFEELL